MKYAQLWNSKKPIADVFSSLPHPYFLPILSALIIVFTIRPAIINPILRKRQEKKQLEQINKQTEVDELIPLIDEILKQFDICDRHVLSTTERLVHAMSIQDNYSEGTEHFNELKRMIVGVYAKVKKYKPPRLTSSRGANIDYRIDFKAYNSLKKFFFELRSVLS